MESAFAMLRRDKDGGWNRRFASNTIHEPPLTHCCDALRLVHCHPSHSRGPENPRGYFEDEGEPSKTIFHTFLNAALRKNPVIF